MSPVAANAALMDRLSRYVDRSDGADSCWTWSGPVGGDGRPMICVGGKVTTAVRAIYWGMHGHYPDERLWRTCASPGCVNVSHHRFKLRRLTPAIVKACRIEWQRGVRIADLALKHRVGRNCLGRALRQGNGKITKKSRRSPANVSRGADNPHSVGSILGGKSRRSK